MIRMSSIGLSFLKYECVNLLNEEYMRNCSICFFSFLFFQLGGWTVAGKEAHAQFSCRFPTKQTIGPKSQICARSEKHTL